MGVVLGIMLVGGLLHVPMLDMHTCEQAILGAEVDYPGQQMVCLVRLLVNFSTAWR
jgi:hypothetical protein